MEILPKDNEIEVNTYPVGMDATLVPSLNSNTPATPTAETNIVPAGNGSVMAGGNLQSPNYVDGVSGWLLDSDGRIKGVMIITNGGRIANWYIYTNTIASGSTEAGSNVLIDSANSLIRLGPTSGNYITLDGTNLRIRSSNYVAGASGFTVEPTLVEAENIKARGSLAGATFKYDVVSAVGGQLIVANADVISTDMTALDASTMTIKGDVALALNDIILIRAVATSGIQEEYMRVTAVGVGATSTSTTFPGTGADDNAVGTVAWTNPGNITADDASYAVATYASPGTAYSHYLKGTNFGFSIPTGATINGIEVTINKNSSLSVYDEKVRIIKADGSIGTTDKSSASIWPTSLTSSVYGGSSDLWGETWTAADINDADFGVALQAKLVSTGVTQAVVDYFTIKVYYTFLSTNEYSITRDLAASFAANSNPAWKAGTPVTVQGSSDGAAAYSGGYLRLLGAGTNAPHYSVFKRTGVAYDAVTEYCRLGNLNGFLGYVSEEYGLAIGESTKYLKYDPTNGLRIAGQIQSTVYLTAGEALTDGNAVMIGAGTAIAGNSQTSQNSNEAITDPANWKSMSFSTTSKAIKISSVVLYLAYNSATPVTVTVAIYASSGGLPTGAALGSVDVNISSSPSPSPTERTFTFATPITVSASTTYQIVAHAPLGGGGDSVSWYYQNSGSGAGKSGNGGSTWSTDANKQRYYKINEIQTVAGNVYKASAAVNNEYVTGFIGFVIGSFSAGQTATILIVGQTTNLSGLTVGSAYYLSDTSGAISTTPGTVSKKVGISLSATSLLILNS